MSNENHLRYGVNTQNWRSNPTIFITTKMEI